VADDYAAVAVAQHSITSAADRGCAMPAPARTVADRAERGVELLSRWAGILAFVGAVAAIAYLIF
jgi:hypothetical protein